MTAKDSHDGEARRVGQACDACKRRKVKCNGKELCNQCAHFNIKCTYTPIVRGRPRKGAASRGSVIQECRKAAVSGGIANGSNSLQPKRRMSLRLNGDNNDMFPVGGMGLFGTGSKSAPLSPLMSVPHTPTLHLLDPDFFLNLIPDYMTAVYPVNPIITEAEIVQCVEQMHTSRDACSFLYGFAAVTINLSKTDPLQFAPDVQGQVSNLLNRCFDQMEPMHMQAGPNLFKVMRNIFAEICLMGLNKMDLGFFYLREAISMLQIMGAGNADPSFVDSHPDKHKIIRAYWECFIHERYTALTDYKPTCLHQLSRLPEHDPDLDPGIQQGWLNLIKTFLLVDDPFINYWVGDRVQVTPEWIEHKHRELEDEQWEHEVHLLNKMQQADLIITRQWLRTLTWQMALSNILLSSHPQSECLSLTLPLRLSSQLRQFLSGLRPQDVGIHGTGILQKLFEITITIADVVIQYPDANKEDMLLRADDVLFLKKFVFSFPRIMDTHKEELALRMTQMLQRYPEIAELEAQYSPVSMIEF